jgi:hypothetical protein
LKSTRMNTRLLVKSMSRIESFAMGMRLPSVQWAVIGCQRACRVSSA